MINRPNWLPDIISFSDFNSDWVKYAEHLFQVFKKDFINSRPFYNNKPVLFDNRLINGYPACFWHLMTEDKIEDYARVDEENISLLRCERICWIRSIIENYKDKAVSVWENIRQQKRNTVFFLEDYNYVVVLTHIRKGKYLLMTAYYVNYSHSKNKLIKERDEYFRMQKPPQNGTV